MSEQPTLIDALPKPKPAPKAKPVLAMSPPLPGCASCRYRRDEECRRFPPIGAQPVYNGAPRPIWPPVDMLIGCGEHQNAETVQ